MIITHLASQIDSHSNASTYSSVHALTVASRSEHSDSSALMRSTLNESLRFFFLISHGLWWCYSGGRIHLIDLLPLNPCDNLHVVKIPLNWSCNLNIQIFLQFFYAFILHTLPPKSLKFGFFSKLIWLRVTLTLQVDCGIWSRLLFADRFSDIRLIWAVLPLSFNGYWEAHGSKSLLI